MKASPVPQAGGGRVKRQASPPDAGASAVRSAGAPASPPVVQGVAKLDGNSDPLWPLAVEIAREAWARPRVVARCVVCRFEWLDGETPQACGEQVCPLGERASESPWLLGARSPSGAPAGLDGPRLTAAPLTLVASNPDAHSAELDPEGDGATPTKEYDRRAEPDSGRVDGPARQRR